MSHTVKRLLIALSLKSSVIRSCKTQLQLAEFLFLSFPFKIQNNALTTAHLFIMNIIMNVQNLN